MCPDHTLVSACVVTEGTWHGRKSSPLATDGIQQGVARVERVLMGAEEAGPEVVPGAAGSAVRSIVKPPGRQKLGQDW